MKPSHYSQLRGERIALAFAYLLTTHSAVSQGATPRDGHELPAPADAITTQSDSILVQLDWEPTAWHPSPSQYQPFGRVPKFTLLADGRLVFLHRIPRERESVLSVMLSPAQADSIRRRVLAMGFGALESHISQSKQQSGGGCVVVSDASYSIIRVRMPNGELRTIKNYAEFANEPVVLDRIRRYLDSWYSPAAVPFVPDHATLVIVSCEERSERSDAVPGWPLDPALLTSAPVQRIPGWGDRLLIERAHVMNTREYEMLSLAGQQYMGLMVFAHKGSLYTIVLRPWLPGEDFNVEVNGYRGRWGD